MEVMIGTLHAPTITITDNHMQNIHLSRNYGGKVLGPCFEQYLWTKNYHNYNP